MKEDNKSIIREAFTLSVPVATGFLPLGAAFGILMHSIGYNWMWSAFFSLVAFAGSIQYLSISFLTSAFNPINAFLVSLMVNARHLFYGISLMDKYKDSGKYKNFLIFGMCDETFSITSSLEIADRKKRDKMNFYITLFDYSYWVAGSAIGGLIAGGVKFNTMGMDFALTALFVVLFLEQMLKKKNRIPGLTGLAASILSLMVFGSGNMIIPAMIIILVVFFFGGDRLCS
ncbi:MAG: AzlC family ABC transporter permease [Eubacteriaceae bacterium]|nr:AzlC family ABC transporter permease [Eubacteriaceae bacterium]